jgi:hypothetical protein
MRYCSPSAASPSTGWGPRRHGICHCRQYLEIFPFVEIALLARLQNIPLTFYEAAD